METFLVVGKRRQGHAWPVNVCLYTTCANLLYVQTIDLIVAKNTEQYCTVRCFIMSNQSSTDVDQQQHKHPFTFTLYDHEPIKRNPAAAKPNQ